MSLNSAFASSLSVSLSSCSTRFIRFKSRLLYASNCLSVIPNIFHPILNVPYFIIPRFRRNCKRFCIMVTSFSQSRRTEKKEQHCSMPPQNYTMSNIKRFYPNAVSLIKSVGKSLRIRSILQPTLIDSVNDVRISPYLSL